MPRVYPFPSIESVEQDLTDVFENVKRLMRARGYELHPVIMSTKCSSVDDPAGASDSGIDIDIAHTQLSVQHVTEIVHSCPSATWYCKTCARQLDNAFLQRSNIAQLQACTSCESLVTALTASEVAACVANATACAAAASEPPHSALLDSPSMEGCADGLFRCALSLTGEKATGETIAAHFLHSLDRRVSINPVLGVVAHTVLLICREKSSAASKKRMIDLLRRTSGGQTRRIEFFLEMDVLVDPTAHCSVPKHRLLSEEETEEMLHSYRVTASQLPLILVTDPVCRWYGAQEGAVFAITRPSLGSGAVMSYRRVSGAHSGDVVTL